MSLGADMTRNANITTEPGGPPPGPARGSANVDAARYALYATGEAPAVSAKKKRNVLQIELVGSRVKREEIMHLSRQLGAFIKAGLPLVEAVRVLGEEAS